MRPRVFPAEDIARGDRIRHVLIGRSASMRPRVFPAEDGLGRLQAPRALDASMRPRVFPAEDFRAAWDWFEKPSSFNEAAGIPRGRPRHLRTRPHRRLASMRPRVFPAEDVRRHGGCVRRGSRFNEAAGIPRGRPAAARPEFPPSLTLQ